MPLPNGVKCGTKYVVEVPANGIPLPGVDAITAYLAEIDVRVPGEYDAGLLEQYVNYRQYNVRAGLDDAGFEWVWKTTRGTLPKRLDSTLRRLWDVKLPREAISQLGNIASEHTERINRHVLEFTQDFGWQRGEFGDDDSCFWTERRGAKGMLHSMGAYALRFYNPDDDECGWARSWLVPTNDFYVLFNAYSKDNIGVCYDALSQSRILAYFLGCSYKRVDPLLNNGTGDDMLWINGRKQNDYTSERIPHGYVVGYPEDIADVKEYDFKCVNVDSEEDDDDDSYACCACCGCDLGEYDVYLSPGGAHYCESCYDERYTSCERCEETVHWDDIYCVDGQTWCDYCTRRYASWCDYCEEYHCVDDCHSVVVNDRGDAETWCTSCCENYADRCDECCEYFANVPLTTVHGGFVLCPTCVSTHTEECEICGSINYPNRWNGSCYCEYNRDQRLMARVAALDFGLREQVAV